MRLLFFLHFVLLPLHMAGAQAVPNSLQDSLQASIQYLSTTHERMEQTPMDSLSRKEFDLQLRELNEWAYDRPTQSEFGSMEWILLGDLFSWLDVFDQREAFSHSVNAYKHAIEDQELEWIAVLRLFSAYRKVGLAPGIKETGARLIELNEDLAIEEKVEFDMAIASLRLGQKEEAWKWIKAYCRHFPEDLDGKDLKKRIRKEK